MKTPILAAGTFFSFLVALVAGLPDCSAADRQVRYLQDIKPILSDRCYTCEPMPESFTQGQPIAQLQGKKLNCFGPQFKSMEITAKEVDQATLALIRDLRQRGMLDDTLVVWGGEFGRTPMAQGNGRDFRLTDVAGHVIQDILV